MLPGVREVYAGRNVTTNAPMSPSGICIQEYKDKHCQESKEQILTAAQKQTLPGAKANAVRSVKAEEQYNKRCRRVPAVYRGFIGTTAVSRRLSA